MNPPDESVVEYQGQLSLDDVMRGFHLSRKSRGRTVALFLIWGFIAGVVILSLTRPALLPALAWWLFPFAIVAAILDLVTLPMSARKSLRQHQALYAPFQARFDHSGLHSASTHDTSQRPWESFRFWKEDQHTFILAESPTAFRIIPKRMLGNQDADRLRALFRSRIGKPA
jgi:hypothetical protein